MQACWVKHAHCNRQAEFQPFDLQPANLLTMSDIAIRVDNLSKMYRIGTHGEQPRGLVQAARSLVNSPFAYLNRMRQPLTAEETL